MLGSDDTADRPSDRRGESVGEDLDEEAGGDSFPVAALGSAAVKEFSSKGRGSPANPDA